MWSIAVSLAQRASNPGLEVSTLCNLVHGILLFAILKMVGSSVSGHSILPSRCLIWRIRRTEQQRLVQQWHEPAGGPRPPVTPSRGMMQRRGCWKWKPISVVATGNYFVTFASAMLHAGNVQQTGYFLQKNIAAAGVTPDFALEQSIVQAEIWNRLSEYGPDAIAVREVA